MSSLAHIGTNNRFFWRFAVVVGVGPSYYSDIYG
jgi:hypothetical protein